MKIIQNMKVIWMSKYEDQVKEYKKIIEDIEKDAISSVSKINDKEIVKKIYEKVSKIEVLYDSKETGM